MNAKELYHELNTSAMDTIEVDGLVLMYDNRGTTHLCKTSLRSVAFACGSSGPPSPGRYHFESSMEERASVDTPQEALEHPVICRSCQTIMEDEFDLVRVVTAVPEREEDTSGEQEITRFVENWENESE